MECKNQNRPVLAKEIRDFYGKLASKKWGLINLGIFVTSSRYTQGALDSVKLFEIPILTIGYKELKQIVYEQKTFSQILQGKIENLLSGNP